MATLIVNTAKLRSTAEELRQLDNDFNNLCNQLEQLEQTMSRMWKGESYDEFHNYFRKNRSEFNDFYKGIQDYIRELLETARRYEEMERQNKATAKSC